MHNIKHRELKEVTKNEREKRGVQEGKVLKYVDVGGLKKVTRNERVKERQEKMVTRVCWSWRVFACPSSAVRPCCLASASRTPMK
jgi:hypothetical protein